tara:strand:+ start:2739 stop:3500 length:762 start_codon:yes stop_codon:yes gene_type:complete
MSLEQDYTTVPGQLFACLSVVGPEAPQKNDKFGIKIRGAFATRDEAASHAKRLQKEDSTFDIYVVDMYKWLLIPPDPVKIEDVHYSNEKLEELMQGYRENQAAAAKMFNERKLDMAKVREDGNYNKPGDENSKFYNKPDEPPISHPSEVVERLQKENPDANMEDLVKEADKIIAEEMKERNRKREEDAQKAKEKEATDRGFDSVEAMEKHDKERQEEETKRLKEESDIKSTEAQVTENEIEDGEIVESKNTEV